MSHPVAIFTEDIAALESTSFDIICEINAGLQHVDTERHVDGRRDVLVRDAAVTMLEASRDPKHAAGLARVAAEMLSQAIELDRLTDQHRDANARREQVAVTLERSTIAFCESKLRVVGR